MKLTDVDFAVEASGMVRAFNQAGVLDVSDVHVAQRLCALAGESDERVALAVAVAVRALRAGSVCVDLLSIARVAGHDDLPWPDPADWLAAVRASPLLADPPVLHLYDDRLLYLDRYWREEEQVCADLLALLTSRRPAGVPDLRRLFPTGFDEQRRAAEIALSQGVTVLTGGPGTGKTTTVARLLALVAEQAELAGEPRPRIALAAPTGKAAARLAEAVRPGARLILVGDADQLASVEAGAVLADLVDGFSVRDDALVAQLRTSHRFGKVIGTLAEAIRAGDGDAVLGLLRSGEERIEFVDDEDPAPRLRAVLVPHALRLREAALLGASDVALATLDEHRLLCAHRDGPTGVLHWNRRVQAWLAEETGQPPWTPWYAGRPLLVTANDYGLRVYNGDTGVVLAGPTGLRAVISGASGPLDVATGRLGDVETMHAMTIHKSQGSQVDEVTVLMPQEDSRLLTRELLYTAVARAKRKVRVVGSEASVRAAIARRAVRASGLRMRLQSTGCG